jgi:hypothetical protein
VVLVNTARPDGAFGPVFLELSPPEKDCSFVNIPDRSLSDIARLQQTIKYKL